MKIPFFLLFLLIAFLNSLPSPEKDGLDAVKQFVNDHLISGLEAFNRTGKKRFPSPDSWAADIVYSIQVDRFNNGDYSNDGENLPPIQDKAISQNPKLNHLHEFRHGGDLQGILDRLDYLENLGVNSLWITPVLRHNGDYHGYCTTNLLEIDPGFGTDVLFARLVEEAHSRGIKIIMDVVINHLCDRKTYYSQQPNHYQACEGLSFNNWNDIGGQVEGQGELKFSEDFFPLLKSQYFFNKAGANSMEDMQGTGPAAVYGDFTSGMFDYDTRNRDFQEIFSSLMAYWIAYADVDGFRLDAAKHVTEDFIAYFCSRIRNFAASIGKNNFYIIGEVAGPPDWVGSRLGKMYTNENNPNDHGKVPKGLTSRIRSLKNDNRTDLSVSTNYLIHEKFRFPGLTAAYDFGHGGTMRNTLRNEISISNLANFLISDYEQILQGQASPLLNWNVLEIHDWNRFLAFPYDKNVKRGILGISYLMTAKGIPHIYYGQEQGFNQMGKPEKINVDSDEVREEMISIFSGNNDALKRQNMFMGPWRLGSAVIEIDQLSYIGKNNKLNYDTKNLRRTSEDPFLNQNHELYRETRALVHIRKSCRTLQEGEEYVRFGGLTNEKWGILAFSRILEGDEIVVIINNSDNILTQPDVLIDARLNQERSLFVNLRNGYDKIQTFKGKKGELLLGGNGGSLQANEYKIYVKAENIKDWDEKMKTHLCKF